MVEKIVDETGAKNLDKELSKVRFFPGSLREYEIMVGYGVEVIDTGLRDMGITFLESILKNNPCQCIATKKIQDYLVEQGIEAIVNCAYRRASGRQELGLYYGLPVTKKVVLPPMHPRHIQDLNDKILKNPGDSNKLRHIEDLTDNITKNPGDYNKKR